MSTTSEVQELASKDPAALFDLSGRSALITGATGALGSASARALAAAGAKVTLAGGNSEALEALGSGLRGTDAEVEIVARRPEELADAEAMVKAAVDAHGRLDLLVTASGTNSPEPIVEQEPESFDAIMNANVRGTWLACKAAGRQMIEQGDGGKAVLVSSTRGKLGMAAGYTGYSASKGAVNLLTRTLAWEWGAVGINVNAIAPTVFRSDLTAWMYEEEGKGKAVREGMLARIPLGRLGEPEDFVGALIYFLSPASDFCTGQILYIDGGYTAG
jgi:NAD(P)-dependent dehydrogenase (short-subunit alcohol dehydrogenase family)